MTVTWLLTNTAFRNQLYDLSISFFSKLKSDMDSSYSIDVNFFELLNPNISINYFHSNMNYNLTLRFIIIICVNRYFLYLFLSTWCHLILCTYFFILFFFILIEKWNKLWMTYVTRLIIIVGFALSAHSQGFQ